MNDHFWQIPFYKVTTRPYAIECMQFSDFSIAGTAWCFWHRKKLKPTSYIAKRQKRIYSRLRYDRRHHRKA